MPKDPLKQFIALQENLQSRKLKIEAELAALASAFGTPLSIPSGPAATAPRAKRSPGRPKGSGKRAKNDLSLREAVLTVTKDKPLAKAEILEAVGKLGYKFSAKDPMNSLNTFLYTSKAVKKADGKFGPSGK